MRAKDLVAKLNKLIEIKPDANVYLFANEEDLENIGNRLLTGNHISDIDLILSRSYEAGEGFISLIE